MLKIWRWLGKGKDFVQWAELKFKLNWFNFGGRKGVGFLKNLDILTAPENLRKESKNNNNLKKRVTHPHTNTHTYIYMKEWRKQIQYCFHSRETNAGKVVEIRRVLVGFRPICIPTTIRSTNKTTFLLVLRNLFVPAVEMKGSCALAASVLAASVVALSSSSGDREVKFTSCSEQVFFALRSPSAFRLSFLFV